MGWTETWLAGALLAATPSIALANFGDRVQPAGRPVDPGSPTPGAPGAPSGPDEPGPDEPGSEEPGPLFPRLPLSRAAGWLLPPEPQPSDREAEAQANLDRYFDAQLDRDRLAAGVVDGWYYEVGRSMRQRFRPDRQRVESERHRGMTLLQRAYDELRRYAGGPERPQDVPGQPTPEMRGTDPTDRRAAVVQEMWDQCNPLNGTVTWYRTDMRVTHNPEGELSAAWVLRTSGIEALDDDALEAARSGAVALPAPPANMIGERQAIQSDWAFEMGDVATLSGCGATCVDDPIQGIQCANLGRGIVRTRFRLLGVIDANHPTADERRVIRRQQRVDNEPPRE